MSRRSQLFIVFLLVYAAATAFFINAAVSDVDPRYRESAEDSLVETAHLLATLIEQDVQDGAIVTARLNSIVGSFLSREVNAQIYAVTKNRMELRAYVTDDSGRVLFDSTGRAVGEDFSQWRDVRLTLQGQYGARTTPDIANEPQSSVIYVAAPVRWNDKIIGVVTAGKPIQSYGPFIVTAQQRMLYTGLISAGSVLLFLLIVSFWLLRPFALIGSYLKQAIRQRSFSVFRLMRQIWHAIGAAVDEIRDALSGRSYVTDYVQSLTHELKSPLSAIRGAVELMQDDAGKEMPEDQRQRFLNNIALESSRLQEIIERMLELSALEAQRVLSQIESIEASSLLDECAQHVQASIERQQLHLRIDCRAEVATIGDRFLLRRAVVNLLENAIDFSPPNSTITLSAVTAAQTLVVEVHDEGAGIPDYAAGKIFERFYSLARPGGRRKSTGLGLPFVKEIAALHQGSVELENHPLGGAVARLHLPLT